MSLASAGFPSAFERTLTIELMRTTVNSPAECPFEVHRMGTHTGSTPSLHLSPNASSPPSPSLRIHPPPSSP